MQLLIIQEYIFNNGKNYYYANIVIKYEMKEVSINPKKIFSSGFPNEALARIVIGCFQIFSIFTMIKNLK